MIALLDGELDETQRARVQEHVDHCVCCTVEMETERDIERRLGATWLDPEIESALGSVEHVDRRLIILSSILDLNYDNVAADLKWTVDAVASGMVRARRALRLELIGPVVSNGKPESSYDVH
jgi:DNA-directed RNA polymerase specialized sigma24 family protein